MFMEGRTIWGDVVFIPPIKIIQSSFFQLYYCRYNEAYILYKYDMDFWQNPEQYPEKFTELAHHDPLHCSEENPMETRVKNGATEVK